MSKFMRVVMVAVVGMFLTSAGMAQGTQGPAKPAAAAQQDTTKKKEMKKGTGKASKKKAAAKSAKADSTKMKKS